MKTTPPRSGLTWKPTSRIFTSVGLRWIPMGKTVETCLNINDSAIPLGKETCYPKTVICPNSSSLNAVTYENPSSVNIKQHRDRDTSKYSESNASALEDLTLRAGNPIKEIGEEIDGLGVEFTSSCVGILVDGRDIKFWVYRWVDNRRLCDRFPRLYHLDRRKETSVMDRGGWVNNTWVCKWDWVRSVSVSKEYGDLIGILQHVVVSNNCRDRWRWSLGEDGAGLCWVGCAIIRDSSVICLQVQCMFRFTGDIFSLVGLLHSNVNVGFQIVLVPFLLLFYVSDLSFWIVG
ncbi:hypothetical protein Tco_0605434 [Tanacetum coccineum]